MLFHNEEYLLLSRSGNVPLSRTRPVHRPAPAPSASDRRVRPGVLARRLTAVRAVRGGLRATWTAFGPGSAEL